jgi:hypothetical protein
MRRPSAGGSSTDNRDVELCGGWHCASLVWGPVIEYRPDG